MKAILTLLPLVFLSACAHHPRKVECDAHLAAINAPTPIVKGSAPPAVTPGKP